MLTCVHYTALSIINICLINLRVQTSEDLNTNLLFNMMLIIIIIIMMIGTVMSTLFIKQQISFIKSIRLCRTSVITCAPNNKQTNV